jgi:hypothetical protein
MELQLLYRTVITDEKGKIVKRGRWRKSRSFVKAFLQHVYGSLFSATISVIDTGNAARTLTSPTGYTQPHLDINAAADNSAYGFVVGTGTTAPTNTDYALVAQIGQGTGENQLDHGVHSVTIPAVVSGNVDMVISRAFYNGSGATITVKEIGIYCRSYDGAMRYFCVVRDVLAASVDVLDTQTLTVQYTLRTTV